MDFTNHMASAADTESTSDKEPPALDAVWDLIAPCRPIPTGGLVVSGPSTGLIAGDRAMGRAGIIIDPCAANETPKMAERCRPATSVWLFGPQGSINLDISICLDMTAIGIVPGPIDGE